MLLIRDEDLSEPGAKNFSNWKFREVVVFSLLLLSFEFFSFFALEYGWLQ